MCLMRKFSKIKDLFLLSLCFFLYCSQIFWKDNPQSQSENEKYFLLKINLDYSRSEKLLQDSMILEEINVYMVVCFNSNDETKIKNQKNNLEKLLNNLMYFSTVNIHLKILSDKIEMFDDFENILLPSNKSIRYR